MNFCILYYPVAYRFIFKIRSFSLLFPQLYFGAFCYEDYELQTIRLYREGEIREPLF